MNDYSEPRQRMKWRNLLLAAFLVMSLAYLTDFGRDLYDLLRGFHDGFLTRPSSY